MKAIEPGPDHDRRDEGGILAKLHAQSSAPVTVQWRVTERCPLSCKHCYQAHPSSNNGEIPTEEVVGLLRDWADTGVLMLSLTGGEPALRDDLEMIVDTATDLGFFVRLKTSGSFLNRHRLEVLHSAGLAELQISLYHLDPALNDEFVGMPSHYAHASELLEHFITLGGRVRVNTLLMNWNAEALAGLYIYWTEKKANIAIDLSLMPCLDGREHPLAFSASAAQIKEFVAMSRQTLGWSWPEAQRRSPSSSICGAGKGYVVVNANGDVTLCDYIKEPIGNVRQERLETIWTRSAQRRHLATLAWNQIEKCGTCDCATLCAHCPAAAINTGRGLLGHLPEECSRTKAIAQALEESTRILSK